MHTYNPMR